ncbi:MAG: helix-turn-helix transcriptional regulator, partial [Oscillospiraceae bacterium]
MAFKDRLKQARLAFGITQLDLGNKISVAKSTITGYEKGNSEPDMLKLTNIMNVLNVDANFLFQDEM